MILQVENNKLHSLPDSIAIRNTLKSQDKKFVLTNGCFDLLHPGHLSYLKEAKKLGDVLWIALNASDSVKLLKGDTRPVMSDHERAHMLAGLECVDGIVLFHTKPLDSEIRALSPDIYVKAGDYTIDKLDPSEHAALEDVGATINFIPFLPGFSSTSFIEKIKKL